MPSKEDLTKYFKFKTSAESFKKDMSRIIENLKGKKILICISSELEFLYFEEKYKLSKKLNIVNIVDCNYKKKYGEKYIQLEKIPEIQFDTILILSSDYEKIKNQIEYDLLLENVDIQTPFIEYVNDEKENIEYLLKHNFDKTLPKLVKKLKDKKVIFYGAGAMFELIDKYFDLSGFNIIGLTDLKLRYTNSGNNHYLNYPICPLNDIVQMKPDYVLISLKRYSPIREAMTSKQFKKNGIKVASIVKKNIMEKLIDFADA